MIPLVAIVVDWYIPKTMSDKQYYLAMVGEGGVGKRALAYQFIYDVFVEVYDPTMEDSFRKQLLLDGKNYIVHIHDTEYGVEISQGILKAEWKRFSDGFVLVYSCTDWYSFQNVESHYKDLLSSRGNVSTPMVLVGNKCDLSDQRLVSIEEGKSLAGKFGVPFNETSAKMRINVHETFHQLLRQVIKMESRSKKNGGCIMV